MTDKELKLAIQEAIIDFSKSSVYQASIGLFKTLGYNTERQNPLPNKSFDDFKDSFLGTDSPFNEEKACVKDWKSIDLLFQLTADEVSNQISLFNTKQVDNTIIETYLFFSIELTKAEYNRTRLAQITREINKVFPMPVLIVFKHGESITLSVINRRLNKKDAQKDVLEKVTVIKDISITSPHRAHIEILFDLSFSELQRVHKFTNFVELHNAWQKALDTKELNKRFYRDLSSWYFWALQEVRFPTTNWAADKNSLLKEEEKVKEHNAKNLIRLLTRLLFVWFVKEKNLVPDELFDETYIKDNLLNGFEPRKKKGFDHKTQGSKYYRAILQNLFFATLNQTVGKREFRKDGQQMNVTNLMRYESYFKDAKTFIKLVEDVVPFMNGGLFECLDSPDPVLKGKKGGDIIIYEDGFSDRKDNTLCVPDYIFFGTGEQADLSVELGDKKQKDVTVNGLINILKSYKFTVTENTPIEEDIALDPELLGRVFENLLASYNPETKTTARKQTGSFYTPREIVNYMVDESLKAYLKQKLEKSSPPFQGGVSQSGGVVKINNLPHLKTFRKKLRNNLTPAEAKLWTYLQNSQIGGRKFRRQHSVANYILDFYCPSEKLAIELDGEVHNNVVQAEYDRERDIFLQATGIKVLRFENKVVFENVEWLLDTVKKEFARETTTTPSDFVCHPSFSGGELFEERLSDLISYSENQNPFNEEETKVLINAIDNCKILDPACGSGAFPMGILHKLVHILHKLDPNNKLWKERQIKKAQAIDDSEIRDKLIDDIEKAFESNELDYGRKLYLIENCIYGVDIQPIATQISKLRFFISLIVDQKCTVGILANDEHNNFGIRPLPNLETKFVASNTLIGIEKPKEQASLFDNPQVQALEIKLKDIRHRLFSAKTPATKRKLREEDQRIREEMGALLVRSGWGNESARQLASWDPYNQNVSSGWFDSEWMFGIEDGFDVVIGNPPYVQLQKDGGKLADMFKKCGYATFERTGDIYALFYEMGLKALKNGGHLCFITSNKWMRAGYGKSLRKFFISYNPELLIDCGPGVFENATVDVNILLIQNEKNQKQLSAVTLDSKAKDNNLAKFVNERAVLLSNLNEDSWFIGSNAEQQLKEKIERIGKPLKDWDVNIYRGVLTGLNEAFIIDTPTKERLCAEDPKSAEILKPILRGRDIKRYSYEWAGLWIIAIFPALKIVIDKYPAVKKYLLDFGKERLEQVGKKLPDGTTSRKKTGNKWFETQDQICYYEEFEKEKIIYPNMTKYLPFLFDSNNFYTNQKCFIVTGKCLRYLTGYFNSRISYKWIKENCPELQGGTRELSKIFFEGIPIPPITPENQPTVHQIERYVDQILSTKKADPKTDTSDLEKLIDQLVYKLYDLTEEEIAIIEGSVK